MKKYLLLNLILTFSVVTAHAYAPNPKAQAAKQSTADAIKFGIQFGGITGLFGEYKFTEQLGLQTGLGYALATRNLPMTKDDKPVYFLNYLRLPVYLKYYIGETKRFSLFGGINALYFLGGLRVESKGAKFNTMKELTDDEKAKSYDISLSIGLDYETNGGFIWGFRLPELGLLNVVEKPEEFKNMYVPTFILGYNFAKLLK
jgi:hypothetical protein